MNLLQKLAMSTRFLIIIVIVMVGLWMFITPFYETAVEYFGISRPIQAVIGAVIVFVGIRVWKLHPW